MREGSLTPLGRPGAGRAGSWWRVLLTGLSFYFLGLAILVLTGNANLFPTVVILGNFMVPAAYVAFLYDRRHLSQLTMPITVLSFFYGGVLGVFAASLLEPLFVSKLDLLTAFQVGLIEEFVKILGVLVIARRWCRTAPAVSAGGSRYDSEIDGLILGAAAGMGFAALESTGYAFTTFLRSGGSLSVTVAVTLLRGLLSPLGHGTWTAILAGVLYRESRNGHFRLSRRVLGAYLAVAVLHGLWDGLPIVVSAFVTSGIDVLIGQSLVGAVSLLVLWRHWREARRLQDAQATLTGGADGTSGLLPDASPEETTAAAQEGAAVPAGLELPSRNAAHQDPDDAGASSLRSLRAIPRGSPARSMPPGPSYPK